LRPTKFASFALLTAWVSPALAQVTPLDRLKAYIEVDTVNPPGNESRAVDFFAKTFAEAGIAYETGESAPGRGNIWARLEGGDAPALILLNHTDVVPATAAAWQTDPLKAVEKDGMLHGRGALDMKSVGIAQLEAFLALHRSGRKLGRDVIFMATADEEAGGEYGAGWIVKNHPEAFAGAGFLLNEGGSGRQIGGNLVFQVEVAQKRPFWLRLTASDEPGHGSRPLPTSAPTRLIAALQRIQSNPFPPRVTPQVREMFAAYSRMYPLEDREALRRIDESIRDPAFLTAFQAKWPDLHALIRNTCSITMLTGSDKINVVPPVASAELDCRILPDQSAEEFLAGIEERIADDHIRVETLLLFGAAESSSETGLYREIERVTRKHYPSAAVVSTVVGGFTDSHFFRDLGIVSYGYAPFVLTPDITGSAHGNDERIGIAAFNEGVEVLTELVEAFTR
jgi:acetylornithine deacetylase/succinyl-diaminopimelate desuccinylase-like protein